MKRMMIAVLALVLVVSGCASVRSSRLNPLNWFGRSEPVQTTAVVLPGASDDPRPLAENVLSMIVEPTDGGAIVRATALPATQGYWDGELVALPLDDNGQQVFEFRLSPPVTRKEVSTPRSREVTAAVFLTNFKLDKISGIVVQGAANARSSRR